MAMNYLIYKDTAGEWRWRLVDANGRIIADSSMSYRLKSDCLNAVDWLRMTERKNDNIGVRVLPNQQSYDNAVEGPKALSVFLCHSSGDKASVRDLYHRLSASGLEAWLDEENLLPGQDWNQEIRKAVRSSDVVLVCLSQSAINKAGYVQKEIKYALDVSDEQPEGTIFLIPLRLEECEMPERLCRWQWVNLFENKGYEKLMQSLYVRAKQLDKILPNST
jgi:uncharacterized protein YegP (UPF0339 family)